MRWRIGAADDGDAGAAVKLEPPPHSLWRISVQHKDYPAEWVADSRQIAPTAVLADALREFVGQTNLSLSGITEVRLWAVHR